VLVAFVFFVLLVRFGLCGWGGVSGDKVTVAFPIPPNELVCDEGDEKDTLHALDA
jgi:hypothetical protein